MNQVIHFLPLSLRTSMRGGSDPSADDSCLAVFADRTLWTGAESEHDSSSLDEKLQNNENNVGAATSQTTVMDLRSEENGSKSAMGRNWTELAMAAWRRDVDDERTQEVYTEGEQSDESEEASLGWKYHPDPSYDSGELAYLEKQLGDDEPWDFQEPEGGDADELFEQAIALHEQGGDKCYEAERLYRRILALQPSHIGTLCNYGSLCFDFRKDFVTARRAYRRALRLQPDDIPSLTNFADMLGSAVHVSASVQPCIYQTFHVCFSVQLYVHKCDMQVPQLSHTFRYYI